MGRGLSKLLKSVFKHPLFLVVVLFLVTRLWMLGSVPSAVYWDEASLGYNAYSIAQTGHDEWGANLPLHFKAFGEYKLPVYVYTLVPFIKLFGLNAWSVRLPAVLASLASVLLIYLITYKLSRNKLASSISAFFLCVSPWFFVFSRTGYEAILALSLFLASIYFYFLSSKKPYYFILSTLTLGITMYTYNSYRVVAPLTFLFFIVNFSFDAIKGSSERRSRFMSIVFSVFIFAGLTLPIVYFLKTAEGISRFAAIGIEGLEQKKITVLLTVFKNFVKHFDPRFLFISGDTNFRSQIGWPQMYGMDLMLILVGAQSIFKTHLNLKKYFILIFFVAVGLLPASVTREAPHALRSLSALPFLLMIVSLGLVYLNQKITFKYFVHLVVIVYLAFFGSYFYKFTNSYVRVSSEHWQEGYKKVFVDYKDEFKKYDTVLVSDRYAQPYIFALFYGSYDSNKFREEVEVNSGSRFATSVVAKFSNFSFTNVDYYNLPEGRSLIFATPTDKMDEVLYREVILHSDGSPAFYVYEYQKP